MTLFTTTELSVPYASPEGIYVAAILLPIIDLILVGLRMYARTLQRTSIGVDDWLMVPALVRNTRPDHLKYHF